MKYVIVSVVHGKAGEFNQELRQKAREKYGAKLSSLPPHFTIKAPFDYNGSIKELKRGMQLFAEKEKKEVYEVKGYDHFERRVIFMDVIMSTQAKAMHDRFIEFLEGFSYLTWKGKDGKDKRFHITIAAKKVEPFYDRLWDEVNHYPCEFLCWFDNICLYRLEDSNWMLEEKVELHD